MIIETCIALRTGIVSAETSHFAFEARLRSFHADGVREYRLFGVDKIDIEAKCKTLSTQLMALEAVHP